MRSVRTIAALALFVGASLPAQQPALQTDDSFSWTGRIAAGATLHLRNLAGQISVERSTTGQVQVAGRKEWRRGNPADVTFEVVPEGGSVVICAVWFDGGCASDERRASNPPRDAGRGQSRNNDVAVVFTVKLPPGVHLDARGVSAGISVRGASGEVNVSSVSGEVELSDVSGDVSAQSVSGAVRISGTTVGEITASSVSGDVQVDVNALTGTGDITFSSVSGSIEAVLPAQLDADVRMSTVSGRLESAFPLATPAGRRRQNDIDGRIGTGGRALTFRTVSGDISLRRR